MSEPVQSKVVFASAEWVAKAEQILVPLVRAHGVPGQTFSVCEVFTNAPPEVAPEGTVSWHFVIDGKSVRVGNGEIQYPDLRIQNEYQNSLPLARMIYTPENLAERNRSSMQQAGRVVSGNTAAVPSYLIELHNRLAEITV